MGDFAPLKPSIGIKLGMPAAAIATMLFLGCGGHGHLVSTPRGEASKQQADSACHDVKVWSLFAPYNEMVGAFYTSGAATCAGRVTLEQGGATVEDECFTGDSNVVLCTDNSTVNPVKCSPGKGELRISGTGRDAISYARLR
jgi:hypothetical protein